MAALQKLQLAVALALVAIAMPAIAQDAPGGPEIAPMPDGRMPGGIEPDVPADPGSPQAEGAAPESNAQRLDELYAKLAEPGQKDWERIEGEIGKLSSHSGSPSMDLLLARGNKALAEEDYPKAIEHFSSLIDHAPDFAEGWNARATAYFLEGDYALSIADVEHVLVLNPRHFGALTGLSAMLEAMDEPQLALQAMRLAERLTPNRPSVKEAITRLERLTGDVEL